MIDHHVTAMQEFDGSLYIGCSCGKILQVRSAPQAIKQWMLHQSDGK